MNKKKKLWTTLLILCLVGIILVLIFLVLYLLQGLRAQQNQQAVKETVVVTKTVTVTPTPTPEPTPEPELAPEKEDGKDGEATEVPDSVFVDLENPIDFDALHEINDELYAWLRVDGTNIDYPIAQRANDDGFYLHHDMYGDAVFAGCLYTEHINSKDWTDPMTIVYGHNMRNQTMFYDLHKFENQTFFDEHPYFYIYSPDCIRVYEIYAAFTYDSRRTLEAYDLNDKVIFKSYLDCLFDGILDGYQGGITREGTGVNADSRVVTLQTCVGAGGPYRFLVQGVLVSEGGKVVNTEVE